MNDIKEIRFPPEAEKEAIKCAAFEIMRQLCKDGKISRDELKYLAEKHNIPVDKLII